MMNLTREETAVVFQALCLAEAYYHDDNSVVKGMHPADDRMRTERLAGIEPLLKKIMVVAETLT